MEQLTGFSRLVSAHGVSSRPNGTFTLENRGEDVRGGVREGPPSPVPPRKITLAGNISSCSPNDGEGSRLAKPETLCWYFGKVDIFHTECNVTQRAPRLLVCYIS